MEATLDGLQTPEAVAAAVASLRALDVADSTDAPFRATASSSELRASALLRAWVADDGLQARMLDVEHLYLSVLPHLRTKKWYKAVRRMPKAALLHSHFDATADVGVLLRYARRNAHLKVRLAKGVQTVEEFLEATPEFTADAAVQVDPLPDAADGLRMRKDAWYNLRDLRRHIAASAALQAEFTSLLGKPVDGEDLPAELCTPAALEHELTTLHRDPLASALQAEYEDGLDLYIRRHITLRPVDVEPSTLSLNDVWRKFQSTFGVINGLLCYSSAFRAYSRAVFEQLHDDGVSYVELRLNFAPEVLWSDDGTQQAGHEQMLELIEEAHNDFLAARGSGIDADSANGAAAQGCVTQPRYPWWGYKVIVCSLRFFPTDIVRRHLWEALSLYKKHPDRICGVDLVGQEDAGYPLSHWRPLLLEFRAACAASGVHQETELPFILHAGETLSRGGGADDNLYDALALNAPRIGHGFSLAAHPNLLQIVRARGVCVESCPISNELLHLCRTVASHPLPQLLSAGVACAVSSDDGAILSNVGLSHDFAHLLGAKADVDFALFRCLAVTSIRHARLSEAQKQVAEKEFLQHWESYVDRLAEQGDAAFD